MVDEIAHKNNLGNGCGENRQHSFWRTRLLIPKGKAFEVGGGVPVKRFNLTRGVSYFLLSFNYLPTFEEIWPYIHFLLPPHIYSDPSFATHIPTYLQTNTNALILRSTWKLCSTLWPLSYSHTSLILLVKGLEKSGLHVFPLWPHSPSKSFCKSKCN